MSLFRRVTAYARFEQRQARFEGFSRLEVRRLTTGVRLDLGDSVVLKGEVLLNRERQGAPDVDNDVRTASLDMDVLTHAPRRCAADNRRVFFED